MLMEMIIFAIVFAVSMGIMSLFVCYIMMEFMLSKKFWKKYMGKVQELAELAYEDLEKEE